MEEKFLCGIILGMIGGMLITTNSIKARQIVKQGQEGIIDKINSVKN